MLNGTYPVANGSVTEKAEVKPNCQKFKDMVEILKKDLGDALIAADVWRVSTGQSLASYQSKPSRVALFSRITKFLSVVLRDSDLPNLEGYYTLNLADRKLALALPLGECQLALIIDIEKVEVGLVVNVIIPKIMDVNEEAVAIN
jgi:hypothetical protein